MEQTKHPKAETLTPIEAAARDVREPTTRIRTGNLVLLAADERATAQGRNPNPSPVERWPDLLERVQGAARYIRDVEDRAQEQETHVQDLLRQVRADMDAARAQVQAAERETHEVHAQAIKLIQAAEDRAAAAEERAAAAELMLQRIAETIDAEFVTQAGPQDARTRASATRAAS
ncbi:MULTISPECIES: hypothetical protein [Methylobacterium]|uniref:Protein of unassigned function n=2 Tax=Methylobacterium TaxID=407 RepID=A0A089P5I3_9HYPH|nr:MULTISPECIES: hypothetical protein [Methylobacterium]AIQ93308.1 protein of unassigned function [Methylobacterium oryzae CBMB20]MBA9061278.1 hypothetical protein [Methylobacterium fujisawaense]WFS07035.1 hypothetical protein P9K36_27330 [Methylobacterium sp. 391_Methyba4]SFU98951.1 hypothetical protein SAMN02799643_03722 [Methylobacterium sp. UNCCL125]